jgi:hypothetical protein
MGITKCKHNKKALGDVKGNKSAFNTHYNDTINRIKQN